MLPSLKNLIPAALLLTASGALADSSVPVAETQVKEVVTRAPEAPKVDEQLRTLTRAVDSLESEVHQLRAKEAEKAVQEAELLGPNSHPQWP